MRLINLTPHAIVLRHDGVDTVLPPCGTVARVQSTPGVVGALDGVPCPVQEADVMGEVTGLPPAQGGTLYVVSALVGAACRGRVDVLVPGTGPQDNAVRNEAGHIVAVTRLKRV